MTIISGQLTNIILHSPKSYHRAVMLNLNKLKKNIFLICISSLARAVFDLFNHQFK